MSKTSFAVAAVAAAAVLLTPAAASATATRPLELRNGLTLHLPNGWKTYGKGDWIRVVTGTCAKPQQGYGEPECDSFWVLGPKAIKVGDELFRSYNGTRPFYPATDVQLCPHNRTWGQVPGTTGVKGLRQVGPGHKASYREWKATCVSLTGGKVKSRYTQREWYLPTSKVLVVDQWNTPGLPDVLKNASWS
ncbi:hypothetical protein ABT294_21470 [Nonomuraea sp. NPDC000554]|uniref:hypothetical protein n=1 Tax=Nonomuraea sp. NPDC000554 TaxID=3154259 RepID=UPI00332F0724